MPGSSPGMNNYFAIVLFRIIEISSRFIFLGQCLKKLNLEGYGTLSYNTALLQFFSSLLFSGTLQSLSRFGEEDEIKKKQLLSSLSILAASGTLILYAIFGNATFIFTFYSFLYILTGWHGTNNNQIVFSVFRSLSFLTQLIFFNISGEPQIIERSYLSFGAAALILVVCFPWKSLSYGKLSTGDWINFIKFQAHNLSFQLTKIVERWVMLFLLDDKTFGLYSSFRDIINAANLTIFSPIYQIYFKKIASGANHKAILTKIVAIVVFFVFLSMAVCLFVPNLVTKFLLILEFRKFNVANIMTILIFFTLDFLRSIQMMLYEAKTHFKTLFLSHSLDIALLLICLILAFTQFSFYLKMIAILFSRLTMVNIFFIWESRKK